MQPDSLSGGQDALKLKSRGGVVRVFKAAGYSLAGCAPPLSMRRLFVSCCCWQRR